MPIAFFAPANHTELGWWLTLIEANRLLKKHTRVLDRIAEQMPIPDTDGRNRQIKSAGQGIQKHL